SAGDLAKGSGVSSTHLSRIFHSEVGVHIRRYRNTVRLARFWESFGGARQRTLLESAFAAGFGSYTQFYRVFKDEYGRGPREAMRRSEEKVESSGISRPAR
ncbi:MAG: AraC family transcriptional regulator, partial [bacterium]|nr:AraC family transcriptional regulator [bacterium]